MRIPRDIQGYDLAKALKVLGYEITRQAGSHIRLTTYINGAHHITIPNHDPIKVGTLSVIPGDIAHHFGISKDELSHQLWK